MCFSCPQIRGLVLTKLEKATHHQIMCPSLPLVFTAKGAGADNDIYQPFRPPKKQIPLGSLTKSSSSVPTESTLWKIAVTNIIFPAGL